MLTPRAPGRVALADLLHFGYIDESEVARDGRVDEQVRRRAERAYSAANPRSPPRREPTVPTRGRAILPATSRTSATHVHRVHLRREHPGTRRLPQRMVLDTCCICYAADRDHVVMPCFHVCVCAACAARIRACPMCRGDIDAVRRIFL